MMKKIVYLIVLMFLVSSVLGALTITLDKSPPHYDRGSNAVVGVSVSCTAGRSTTLHIRNAENPSRLVYIAVGNGTWKVNYNVFSDASDGRYSLEAFCQDGSNATTAFCVNANGCLTTPVPPLPPSFVCGDGLKSETEGCDDRNTQSGDGCSATCSVESGWSCTENAGGLSTCTRSGGGGGDGSGGGGSGGTSRGRSRCASSWSCDAWGLCNATKQQSRTCTDTTQCERKPRIEVRSCTSCQESWTCLTWSECRSGSQYRTCNDEHRCGTLLQRPETEKRCDTTTVGFPPRKVLPEQPVVAPPSLFPPFEPPRRQPVTPPKSFLGKYQKYAIPGGIGIGVLIILVIVAVIFIKKRSKGNMELARWAEQARSAGKSDTYIQNALMDQGWAEKEIEKVLKKR